MISSSDEKTIWRCQSCQWVVTAKDIAQGGCAMCGGRRVQIAVKVSDEEIEWLGNRGYVFDDERWTDVPHEDRQS